MKLPRAPSPTSHGPHLPSPTRSRAFTLLEMIAVLTVIVLLASAVALNVLENLRWTARSADRIELQTMTEALKDHILRTHRIPPASEWPDAIAQELSVPVGRVLKSAGAQSRLFLEDPDLEIGSPAIAANLRKLPYTQGGAGSVPPSQPRLTFLSSLGNPIPSVPATASAFLGIWNTAPGQLPSGWSAGNGDAEDLAIERLDLRSLFVRVVLSNVDPGNAAPYSLQGTDSAPGSAIISIPTGNRVETWLFLGTVVNLHYANQSLQAREVLREDISYIFENGRWNRYLNYGWRPPLSGFGLLAEQFRTAPLPADPKFGATPQAVVEEVFTYLYTYGVWATGTPPSAAPFETGGSTSSQQIPAYQVLLDAQKRLEIIAGNLIN